MWCEACQQDMPGIVSSTDEQLCCAVCGTQSPRSPQAAANGAGADLCDRGISLEEHSTIASKPPIDWDDWETEETLRAAARILKLHAQAGENQDRHTSQTRHAEQAALPAWNWPPHAPVTGHAPVSGGLESSAQSGGYAGHLHSRLRPPGMEAAHIPHRGHPEPRIASKPSWLQIIGQLGTAVGLMALACGGVLLVWSLATARDELWNLGLPIAVAGQVAVLLGAGLTLLGKKRRKRSSGKGHSLRPTPDHHAYPVG